MTMHRQTVNWGPLKKAAPFCKCSKKAKPEEKRTSFWKVDNGNECAYSHLTCQQQLHSSRKTKLTDEQGRRADKYCRFSPRIKACGISE